MHLREVMDDDKKQEVKKIKLNGSDATEQDLDRIREDKSKKLVETQPGEYIELQRLRG